MALAPGTRIGTYEIVAPLGKGGLSVQPARWLIPEAPVKVNPNPGRPAKGPVCPYMQVLNIMSSGFIFLSSSYPNPKRSMDPGV